jgi:hypothetical protein
MLQRREEERPLQRWRREEERPLQRWRRRPVLLLTG